MKPLFKIAVAWNLSTTQYMNNRCSYKFIHNIELRKFELKAVGKITLMAVSTSSKSSAYY